MKRTLLILVALIACLALVAPAMAVPHAGPEGYYQKVNGGKNVGKIKYFENGHPVGPSEWLYLGPGSGPPGCESSCKNQAVVAVYGNLGEITYRGFDVDGQGYLVPNGDVGAFYGGSTNSRATAFAKGKWFAFAHASITERTTGGMAGFTTGPVRSGTSFLVIGSYSKTSSKGFAIAIPGRRCPSGTVIVLKGEAFQGTYGSTFSYGLYGSGLPGEEDFAPQSWAGGSQVGTASYVSKDFGTYLGYETAGAMVVGGTILKTYVNSDGTYSSVFAGTGGIGMAYGDKVAYEGSGSVGAATFASNGSSAAATYGSASYSINANGRGCLVAGGGAVTFGHSSVTQSGNGTVIHASQTSIAGTFRHSGGGEPQ